MPIFRIPLRKAPGEHSKVLSAYHLTCDIYSSKLFARFLGLIYIGFAVGPTLASFVLRQSISKNLSPLFFISATIYTTFLIYSLLIIPESLIHKGEQHVSDNSSPHRERSNQRVSPSPVKLSRRILEPLASLRPRRAGTLHKDYTLTVIAVGYFFYLLSLALYQVKYLYAEHGALNLSFDTFQGADYGSSVLMGRGIRTSTSALTYKY